MASARPSRRRQRTDSPSSRPTPSTPPRARGDFALPTSVSPFRHTPGSPPGGTAGSWFQSPTAYDHRPQPSPSSYSSVPIDTPTEAPRIAPPFEQSLNAAVLPSGLNEDLQPANRQTGTRERHEHVQHVPQDVRPAARYVNVFDSHTQGQFGGQPTNRTRPSDGMMVRSGDSVYENRDIYTPTANYGTHSNIGRSTFTPPATDRRQGDSIPISDFDMYNAMPRERVRGAVDADELRRRLETHTALFGDTVRNVREVHAPVVPIEQQYMADWRSVTATPRPAPATRLDDRAHAGMPVQDLMGMLNFQVAQTPSDSRTMLNSEHYMRPPAVADAAGEFFNLASLRATLRDARSGHGANGSASAQGSQPAPAPAPAPAPEPAQPRPPTERHANLDHPLCVICQQDFSNGDHIVFMQCRHTVHQPCFDTLYAHSLTEDQAARCPICRRDANIDSVFVYQGAPASSGYATPLSSGSMFPVFTQERDGSQTSSPYYLSRSDGRLFVILDTGAVGNLCGDRWAQRVASAAVQHRLQPGQTRLPKPLEVGGVGNGTQKAFWEAVLPLAMPIASEDGGSSIQRMTVPMVDQSDLPCLWGLTSLTSNRAIVDLTTNRLHLCGPGDAQINLPPGTTTVQMEREPSSGHLIVPCDLYEEASRNVRSTTTTVRALHATSNALPATSSSSSSAPLAQPGPQPAARDAPLLN